MAFEQELVTRTFIANGAIAPNRFVMLDTAEDNRVKQATAGAKIIGVSDKATHDQNTTNAADTGDELPVHIRGLKMVDAGAAVANGDYVKADSNGKAIPVAGSANEEIGGVAITTASAEDEIVMVELLPGVRAAGS